MRAAFTVTAAILFALAIIAFLIYYGVRSSRIRASLGYDNDPANDPDIGLLEEDDPDEADRIRAMVDRAYPRYKPDGTINVDHVVMESNLRERVGLPRQIMRLDGLSYRRPTDPPSPYA